MVSRDEGAEEVMGTNLIWPTGPIATVTGLAVNLVVAPEAPEGSEAPLLADPADTDDEKARWDAFQLIMQGFHAATRTLSNSYQQACKEVQNIVRRSMKKSTAMDCTFVWGALAAIRRWVRAVQSAMNCMEESLEEQAHLLQAARQAGKEAMEDILALLPVEESPYLTPVVPKEDILTPALQATQTHTEESHCSRQRPDVSPGALARPTATSWSLLSFPPPGNVLLPAGDGRHGHQPGHPTRPDCAKLVGSQLDHDGGLNPVRSPELPRKLASFSG